MKLLEVSVESLHGVPDATYSFANANGSPRDVVVLSGSAAGGLLELLVALLERVHTPASTPHQRAWWAQRRGTPHTRLRARWAFSEVEAALILTPERTFLSEWTFGPRDELPRERWAGEGPSALERTRLGKYAYIDAIPRAAEVGRSTPDPLAKALTEIVRRDVAATRAICRPGVGLVATKTPDTLAQLNCAIAPILPTLRLERFACGRGGVPVACFRSEQRVELDQLADAERSALQVVAALQTENVRDGVVLVARPELHVPREAHSQWLDWLAGLVPTNQLFVTRASPGAPRLGTPPTIKSRMQQ